MRIPRPCLIALMLVMTASGIAFPARSATATKAGDAPSGTCMEGFNEYQRSCGPTPSTADPQSMRCCQEQVLEKCQSGGAAVKSQTIKPGAVNGGLKAVPK
jgi:hypothetical protein